MQHADFTVYATAVQQFTYCLRPYVYTYSLRLTHTFSQLQSPNYTFVLICLFTLGAARCLNEMQTFHDLGGGGIL